MENDHITYSDCGVDIDFAHSAIGQLEQTRSHKTNVITSTNDFAGLFSITEALKRFNEPVLVSGTDGVGTKLMVAIACENYDSLGQDLVAMCANDVATKGAEPLFFLDYFAAAKLSDVPFNKIVNSMVHACDEINCALIGGESADMPSLYAKNHFDLAGFVVGIAERSQLLGKELVQEGDTLLGIASNGLHANGYSLVRKIFFDKLKLRANDVLWQCEKKVSTVSDELLRPTKLYAKTIRDLLNATSGVHAAAHISGGGLMENVPRIIPHGLKASIDLNVVKNHRIFSFIMEHGPVSRLEMLKTFNMGVGMVLAVDKDNADFITTLLKDSGETVYQLGEVIKHDGQDKCQISW